ncbi:MAG: N-(5'-phosphoribosyl)anthranilate isomerase [Pyrinomonadaceae bacterium]
MIVPGNSTVIKICGITNMEDARASVEMGTDALGFNFHEKSSRCISPEEAGLITAQIPETVMKVGVFVNASLSTVLANTRIAGLTAIQLHGDETPEFAVDVKAETGLRVIKAFRVGAGFNIDEIAGYKDCSVLLDAYSSTEQGGTGIQTDWTIARQVRDNIESLYLAGGLASNNVVEAIELVRPYAVDACSRLETRPGKKDLAKVREFVKAVREAL